MSLHLHRRPHTFGAINELDNHIEPADSLAEISVSDTGSIALALASSQRAAGSRSAQLPAQPATGEHAGCAEAAHTHLAARSPDDHTLPLHLHRRPHTVGAIQLDNHIEAAANSTHDEEAGPRQGEQRREEAVSAMASARTASSRTDIRPGPHELGGRSGVDSFGQVTLRGGGHLGTSRGRTRCTWRKMCLGKD